MLAIPMKSLSALSALPAAVQGSARGNANIGLVPNNYLAAAYAAKTGLNVARDSVSWNTVSWDSVSWDNVSWDNVSWDNVSWDNVSWNNVTWLPTD